MQKCTVIIYQQKNTVSQCLQVQVRERATLYSSLAINGLTDNSSLHSKVNKFMWAKNTVWINEKKQTATEWNACGEGIKDV